MNKPNITSFSIPSLIATHFYHQPHPSHSSHRPHLKRLIVTESSIPFILTV